MQERLPYRLADLPTDPNQSYSPFAQTALAMPRTVLNGSDIDHLEMVPPTLASIGASFSRGLGQPGGYLPAFPDGFEPSARENPGRGSFRTAFLQGIGVVGDAAQSGSIGFTVGNEIKPIRPGEPIRRHKLDEERDQWRTWPPVQLDLFDVPRFMPPQGVPQRVIDLVNKPGLEDQMMEAIAAGRTMMGGANWYDTDPLRKRFVDAYGHNAGTAAFYDFMKFIAVTSPGSDVGTNIRNATHYFNRFRRGDPMPEVGEEVPKPYGHRWANLLNRLAKMVAEGKELNPIRYPKIRSMYENLIGNYIPVTVDIHALRLPAMLARDANFLKRKYREKLKRGEISMDDAVANPSYWRNPYPNELPAIEQFYKKLGERANILPSEAQSAAWLGGGHITGLKSGEFRIFMEHFDDRIRRTAEKWGLSEEEVWKRFFEDSLDLVSLDGQRNAADFDDQRLRGLSHGPRTGPSSISSSS